MTEVVDEQTGEVTEVPDTEPETPDEPTTPDDDENTEQDEQPTPEQQGSELVIGMSERELEDVQKKLDRSATTWRNRVSELLGEAAQMLVPCELCDPNIPGFHWPSDVEQPRDQLHASLLDVLRNPAAPEYQQARHVRQCGDCGGWGSVLSGSRVPGKERVTCPTCKGNGFQGDSYAAPATPQDNGQVEVEYPADTRPLVTEDTDVWGSPKLLEDGMENPNYGKMPQYKNPQLP